MATLIAPDGSEFITTDPTRIVRLKAQGYKEKPTRQQHHGRPAAPPPETQGKPDTSQP